MAFCLFSDWGCWKTRWQSNLTLWISRRWRSVVFRQVFKSENYLQGRVRDLFCLGPYVLKNVNKVICVVAPLTMICLCWYVAAWDWASLMSAGSLVLRLSCCGWMFGLGLLEKKFLAFCRIQLDLFILCCHVLKAIAFVDDGGFLVLGYEISVCWRVEKKIIFRHKTGVKLHCHSLLPCLEGILPALKYTFTMRVRKRVCVVGPCSHKI